MSDRNREPNQYGGVNDTGLDQRGLLKAIQEGLGGRAREAGLADVGELGRTPASGGGISRVEGSGDPVADWRKRGGGDYRIDAYKVGSDPEVELMAAQRLGWDGQGDMYDFLSQLGTDPTSRFPTIWVPGQDISAGEVLRTLRGIQ